MLGQEQTLELSQTIDPASWNAKTALGCFVGSLGFLSTNARRLFVKQFCVGSSCQGPWGETVWDGCLDAVESWH